MSSSFDLDRAGLDTALTVVLRLWVAEAVAYADRLAALVVLQQRAEAMTLNPTGVPGAPRSEDPVRSGDTWVTAADEAGVAWASAAVLGTGSWVGQITDAVRLTNRFTASVAMLRETGTTAGGDAVPRMTLRKLRLLDLEARSRSGCSTGPTARTRRMGHTRRMGRGHDTLDRHQRDDGYRRWVERATDCVDRASWRA